MLITYTGLFWGRKTWSLTVREEHRVFENIALRRIPAFKGTKVTGGWKILYG
jgi:hypothetical protein